MPLWLILWPIWPMIGFEIALRAMDPLGILYETTERTRHGDPDPR